jgi:cytoskeletal protein RodZ
MTEQIEMPEDSLLPQGVGPQLRLAREKRGLSIADVAEATRISQRHIAAIEAGDFATLPGRTYAFGFARSIAKSVGLDQEDVCAKVRAELDDLGPADGGRFNSYEPGDPARAPSARLVWFSIIALVILLAGLFMAYRVMFSPSVELPSLVAEQEAKEAAAPAPETTEELVANVASGEVTFTSTADAVWVRFYDAAGRRLMEKEMALGETYTVPSDANGPQLWTGRPDALTITVGGRAIARLSEEDVTMRDVPVDAASLLARGQEIAETSE